jgi:hypothetical protein
MSLALEHLQHKLYIGSALKKSSIYSARGQNSSFNRGYKIRHAQKKLVRVLFCAIMCGKYDALDSACRKKRLDPTKRAKENCRLELPLLPPALRPCLAARPSAPRARSWRSTAPSSSAGPAPRPCRPPALRGRRRGPPPARSVRTTTRPSAAALPRHPHVEERHPTAHSWPSAAGPPGHLGASRRSSSGI